MGKSYLAKEEEKELIKKLLKKAQGETLIISRNPKSPQTGKNQKITNIWLTNIETEIKSIRPQDIEQLSFEIEKFIKNNKKSTVIVTGIEFIISYTSFEQTIHFIETIRDIAIIHDCTLIIHIGKDTLIKNQENLLEQELEPLKIKS